MSSITELNSKFIHPYTDFSSQNSLVSLLGNDINKVLFILNTSYKAFLTIDDRGSRFEPNPIIYLERIYNDIITKEHLEIFFSITNNTSQFINMIKSLVFHTDIELCEYLSHISSLGIIFVKLLYFFIFTNSVAFSSVNVPLISDKGNLYKITHSDEKEREFFIILGESKILLHGTSCRNVYSIMKNGIKSMSKSQYQTNGSVYGDGIYLTDSASTASTYSYEGFSRSDRSSSSTMCVLVFNVKKLNVQGSGFCYVQQENECILRCILWINTSNFYGTNHIIEKISEYASTIIYTPPLMISVPSTIREDLLTIPNATREPLSSESVIKSNRYKKEITQRLFSINNDKTIIKMNYLIPNNNRSPLLILIRPDEESDLAKDLNRYNIPGITLAIYFPSGDSPYKEYPNTPPKIRVISPIFVDGTGRVTKGGSLCADILYPEGWSPANTIEKLLRNLIISIATEGSRNGPGRVDPHRLGSVYRYEDFLFSFSETAGFHGFTAI